MDIDAETLRKIRDKKGMTQKEFADYLQISTRSYQNYESGLNIPPAKKLLIFYKLNAEGAFKLKTDPGEIIEPPQETFNTKAGSQYKELPSGKYLLTVPFVPVRAQATYVSEHTDAEFLSDLTSVSFIVDRVGQGRYMAFEIQNDSMDDGSIRSIPDGAIVLGRELGKQHWKNRFRTKEYPYWIIVHKNTILCKEIIVHDVDRGIITCRSLNDSPEYQDFDLKLDDVYQLFNIIKKQL